MSKFRHHKYTWSKPFQAVYHSWELVGPDGGVHLHASVHASGPSCGLEFHHTQAAWERIYRRKEACHHRECKVLGAPCWHDGTSLYASELWEGSIGMLCERGDHEAIFHRLEREYEKHFEREDGE